MIFRPDLADLIRAGVKTETRRRLSDNPRSPWHTDRCAYEPGGGPDGSYAIQPGRSRPAAGRLVVEHVEKVRLGSITHDGAVAEGCANVREFMDLWSAINGSWDPNETVWRIVFHAEAHAL